VLIGDKPWIISEEFSLDVRPVAEFIAFVLPSGKLQFAIENRHLWVIYIVKIVMFHSDVM
jgi:hypothetical protein